jgi:hypothetical protein
MQLIKSGVSGLFKSMQTLSKLTTLGDKLKFDREHLIIVPVNKSFTSNPKLISLHPKIVYPFRLTQVCLFVKKDFDSSSSNNNKKIKM